LNLQGIIDPVDQIGQGNHHRQFNDFILGIISSNIPQYVGIDCRGSAGNDIRQADGGFFFPVEYVAALVKS
jgi:hypothetical protein